MTANRRYARAVLVLLLGLFLAAGAAPIRAESEDGWQSTFRAGATDASGQEVGGTETVHLAAHNGRLYAGNGYWMDPRGYEHTPWAQVLVLESPGGPWTVDLALGPRHARVTALESLTFATDGEGRPLPAPVTLLLAASDSYGRPTESHIYTRNDGKGTWARTTLRGDPKARRSTRALIVHRDRETGIDRAFVAAGALGIYSGVYDAALPGRVRWNAEAELGPLRIRPMAFAVANGRLYASAGVSVYRRADGASPAWEKVYTDDTREHWELGGIRGLTAVPAPDGRGESVLFSHTDRLIRIDPANEHRATVELRIRPLLAKAWGMPVPGAIIAAYSRMRPLRDPATGRTVHVMGVEARVERGGKDKRYRQDTFFGWYAGGTYLIRDAAGAYRVGQVNGRWAPGKPKLVAPRAFAVSPFPAHAGGHVYAGGFDCNFFPARDTAWIFCAPVEKVLHPDP